MPGAHNRRELDQDALAHAEVLCIRAGLPNLAQLRLSGCQLYVTLEPCPMCSGAIINARLDRVVYGARDPKGRLCRVGGRPVCDALQPHPRHPLGDSGSGMCAAAQRFLCGAAQLFPRSPRNLTVIHTPWMLKTLLKLLKP